MTNLEPEPGDEFETMRDIVEITILWGATVLHVEHWENTTDFIVGEPDPDGPTNFLISEDAIGRSRFPLVTRVADRPAVVIPRGADANFKLDGPLLPTPETEPETDRVIPLPPQGRARIEMNGFTFLVKSVPAARRVGMGTQALFAGVGTAPFVSLAGVVSVVGLLLGILSLSPPSASALSGDLFARDLRMVRYLITPSEVLIEPVDEPVPGPTGGESSGAHDGESGEMGRPDTPQTKRRFAIRGRTEERVLPRESLEEQAREAGALGALARLTDSWNTPTSPYGADQAIGSDPMNAMGAMFGLEPGDDFGFNGLGPLGRGRGGGGDLHEGTIGLDGLNTICRGSPRDCGYGPGGPGGWGTGGTSDMDRRPNGPPPPRSGEVETGGGLSREVIQRVVGRHRNEVRFCYEQGLQARPDLEGRVTIRFVVSPSGAVTTAAPVAARSNLGDPQVQGCIAQAVRRWSFPQPSDGGVVSVTYPFLFTTPNR